MSKIDTFLEKLAGVAVEGKKNETPLEKTAEELQMEKFANQNETIECATTLNLAAGFIEKLASVDGIHPEMKELLSDCSETLAGCSGEFMVGLQKLANSEPGSMVIDMIETQDALFKVATVLNNLADGCEDAEFVKVAAAVNEVNDKLYAELDELASSDAPVRDYITKRFGTQE